MLFATISLIMPPYRGPEGTSFYMSKFIRVGDKLFVTQPDDLSTPHDIFAIREGIFEIVTKLREENPSAVDGGYFDVSPKVQEIHIIDESSRLRIPISEAARAITIVEFTKQSSGYEVTPTSVPIIYPA